jgi:hypothetical protein
MNLTTAATQANEHPVLEKGARLGYVASAVLHVLIAWVILQLAWDMPGDGEADERGALRTIAGSGVGSGLLWLTIVGFVLLAAWQATEALARGGVGDRLKAGGKAVVYLALGWTAFTVVQGADSGGSESLTAPLLATTWGRLVVAAAGLTVVGMGIYHVVKGWSCRFLSDLVEHPGRWAERAGRIGYVAKGVALMLVGGFLVAAAMTADSDQPRGLDSALRTVADMPAGPILLTLAAVGFAAFGGYTFARARHGRF